MTTTEKWLVVVQKPFQPPNQQHQSTEGSKTSKPLLVYSEQCTWSVFI